MHVTLLCTHRGGSLKPSNGSVSVKSDVVSLLTQPPSPPEDPAPSPPSKDKDSLASKKPPTKGKAAAGSQQVAMWQRLPCVLMLPSSGQRWRTGGGNRVLSRGFVQAWRKITRLHYQFFGCASMYEKDIWIWALWHVSDIEPINQILVVEPNFANRICSARQRMSVCRRTAPAQSGPTKATKPNQKIHNLWKDPTWWTFDTCPPTASPQWGAASG